MILRFVYTLFIAILFAALVGFGIAAFYVSPIMPQYPAELKITRPDERVSETIFNELKSKQEQYDREIKIYNRNVALIAITASIITLLISLTLFKKILLITRRLAFRGRFYAYR